MALIPLIRWSYNLEGIQLRRGCFHPKLYLLVGELCT